ncbi:hypothetical protein NX773_11440 [Massilia solisilvae]|uniref:DUF3466 family protein n=1 Tax=Massilia solisilvae TaxID=1811225 RepID=A0ABT2BJV2_9BURK|nr:hypothetical protein [Massilia solisilvae]MCS0608779.1 hypothetical protein [Massilia solisilvae]
MRNKTSFSIATFVALTVPLLALADPRYTVTPIAPAGSWASDINAYGQVAGTMLVSGGSHAFLFSGGTLTDIGTLGGSSSEAARMNDYGQVVGRSSTADASWAPFIYSGGAIAQVQGPNLRDVQGINNAGAVTGTAWIPDVGDGGEWHAYMLAGGTFTDLGTVPSTGIRYSYGMDINDAGHVVGYGSPADGGGPPNWPSNPILYRNGVMTDLGNDGFAEGETSYASAINAIDQVVGTVVNFHLSEPYFYYGQAFLYQDGKLARLGSFGPDLWSWAGDVNNLGQVVGRGQLGDGTHGFLYEHGLFTDLNALIDPATGWVVEDATGINDLGQVAGRACKDGQCYAVRLDLVSAVPAPQQAATLAAGCGLLALASLLRRPARRRRD